MRNKLNQIVISLLDDVTSKDQLFYFQFASNVDKIILLFEQLYGPDQQGFLSRLTKMLCKSWNDRSINLKEKDFLKQQQGAWYTSNAIVGMSLYVDRFGGDINGVREKLPYFEDLGVNLLHLLPVMDSPENESDGGYAVADFYKVNPKLGTLDDLKSLQADMFSKNMSLMLDVVINHTSHMHEWALKAKSGDTYYQNFFYTFEDRTIPDLFERTMPEIFPHSSPGNFTFSQEMQRWVMTVFNYYQWDLNYRNPEVFLAMVEVILFYANLGVDILRLDAPAFVWKKMNTTSQNLEECHKILQLFRCCVDISAPGMALLAEAIVAPDEIMKYFGSEWVKESAIAYNAAQMALQWDALATGKTLIMRHAQHHMLKKPKDTTWITYTRCHDDIGLGFKDESIEHAGFNPYEHRSFLKRFYSDQFQGSFAKGMLFGENLKTNDARISGTLASLCGLEKALENSNEHDVTLAIERITLMQANAMFIGGIPMLFYGDEHGELNDYSYLNYPDKAYDNRWMHRPLMDWKKIKKKIKSNSKTSNVYINTKKLIQIRKSINALSDTNNIEWNNQVNEHLAVFRRFAGSEEIYFVFNYSVYDIPLELHITHDSHEYQERWKNHTFMNVHGCLNLHLSPYQFMILQKVK